MLLGAMCLDAIAAQVVGRWSDYIYYNLLLLLMITQGLKMDLENVGVPLSK